MYVRKVERALWVVRSFFFIFFFSFFFYFLRILYYSLSHLDSRIFFFLFFFTMGPCRVSSQRSTPQGFHLFLFNTHIHTCTIPWQFNSSKRVQPLYICIHMQPIQIPLHSDASLSHIYTHTDPFSFTLISHVTFK